MKLPGYSLIEVSIVLLIVGIISGALLKGRSLIDSVRLDSIVTDVRNLQAAYVQYVDSYANIPGGAETFGEEAASKFFDELASVGLIESASFKKPKIGSTYKIIANDGSPYIQLSGLDEKKINLLKTKLNASFSQSLDIKSDKTSISIKLDP